MEQKEITINNIYRKYLFPYKGRFAFLFGGAGSGKSHAGVQKIVKRCMTEEGHKFLVIRKVARTIVKSVWELFKEQFSYLGIWPTIKSNKVEKTMELPNGNQILFMGIDDHEKLKSIQGITGIFIEEVTELERQDFTQLTLRLRGVMPNYKQIVACFNPEVDTHWLVDYVEPDLKGELPAEILGFKRSRNKKVWAFHKKRVNKKGKVIKTQTLVLNTNYEDNHYIDDEYVAELENLASVSKNNFIVYKKGRWGSYNEGDKYAWRFKEELHVTKCEFNPNIPLHFTCDFNTRPYMSGLVIQLELSRQGETYLNHTNFVRVKVLGEYALSYPKNTSFDLGQSFTTDYQDNLYQGFYLYGDASGKNSIGIKGVTSLFEELRMGLGIFDQFCEMRVPNQNPRYAHVSKNTIGRKNFLNLLLGGRFPVKIEIDESCDNFIGDLKHCEQDKTGRMDKKKNKEGVEERGHLLQSFEYFVCQEDVFGHYQTIK